jgi:hypothetical protein
LISARKIQKRLVEDVAFRLLAAGNEPDFRTVSDFLKLPHKALEAGAIRLGRVALDGTKVQANASKHKAMTASSMGGHGSASGWPRSNRACSLRAGIMKSLLPAALCSLAESGRED